MPKLQCGDFFVNYEEYGKGPTVVLIPGMRNGVFSVRPIAVKLKDSYRVIIYDRTNCGASSVNVTGAESETHRWAEELYSFLDKMKAWPVHLGSFSLGGGVATLLAKRVPHLVQSLFIGWVTGGNFDKKRLDFEMYHQYIEIAQAKGMAGICETPHFKNMIGAESENKNLLLSLDPEVFIAAMKRWSYFFTQSSPLTPLRLSEVSISHPTLLIAGDDDVHLTESAQELRRLVPHCHYVDPIISKSEWKKFKHPQEIAEWRGNHVPPIYLNFLKGVRTDV